MMFVTTLYAVAAGVHASEPVPAIFTVVLLVGRPSMAAQHPYSPYYPQPPQLPPSHHPYAYAQQPPQQPQQQQHHAPSTPVSQPYPTPTSHPPHPYAQQYSAPSYPQHHHPSPDLSSRGNHQQPVQTSPSRRPLPDPRMTIRRPDLHPLPAAPVSSASRDLQHRSSGSVSSVSSLRSDATTSEPPSSPRRLPQPWTIPRSSGLADFVARSTSPSKGLPQSPVTVSGSTSSTDGNGMDVVQSGPKFVPHWRRALPSPSPIERRGTASGLPLALVRPLPSPAASSHSRSNSVQQTEPTMPRPQLPPQPSTARAATFPADVQAGPAALTRPLRQRGRTLPEPVAAPNYPPPSPRPPPAGRAPPSPVASMAAVSTGTSSDDEDIANHVLLQRNGRREAAQQQAAEHARSSSPQYGIRDLPIRRAKSDAPTSQSSTPASVSRTPGPVTAQAPMQSATMRLAAMSLMSESESPSKAAPPSSFRTPVPAQPHPPSAVPPAGNRNVHPTPPMARGGSASSAWPSGLPPLPRSPGSAHSPSSPSPSAPGSSGVKIPPPRSQSLAWSHSADAPTPRTRDLNLNLDDAPPPSLRSSSPARGTSPVRPPPTTHGLPNIRTALPTPPFSPAFASARSSPSPSPAVSPGVVTPGSAASQSSMFTLSSFPAPPSYTVASPRLFGGSAIGDRTKGPWIADSKQADRFQTESPRPAIPKISFPTTAADEPDEDAGPVISISAPDEKNDAPALPSITIASDDSPAPPQINVTDGSVPQIAVSAAASASAIPATLRVIRKGSALACGGCGGTIVGRTVSAMGARWHPGCFRCCVCDELLENLSSYEHDGRAYCHLDYHERFAPKCYHCETAIIDERFITLDDHELGQRTYHEQHFFCAECGNPFLPPSQASRSFVGDGSFGGDGDEVGFTVYRGHPYCESCHVRLRNPKCKRCKRAIRDGARAVEALGGKWCWECFLCASCGNPFEDPSFFQRDGKPFCESCFSIMIKSEM
ncbi:hypothetical protein B0H21DRAFT_34755 [Amylocystis lapponica]|nr:hypothetical protein B0H21DRAFT_34755 [Amylocystis lapponica]